MSGRRFYFNTLDKFRLLFNPALCAGCGRPMAYSRFLCEACVDDMRRVPAPCKRCGLPHQGDGELCPVCLHRPPRWQRMIAPLVFEGLTRRLIHQFKFDQQLHLATALVSHFHRYYTPAEIDILIPVPLHRSRLLDRGFNQSLEIASALSRHLRIPVDNKSLQRVRATESQAGLSLHKRRHNLNKAFAFRCDTPCRAVAVVDDIITSGSTMTEICKTLQRGGVSHIEVWSLARALKP